MSVTLKFTFATVQEAQDFLVKHTQTPVVPAVPEPAAPSAEAKAPESADARTPSAPPADVAAPKKRGRPAKTETAAQSPAPAAPPVTDPSPAAAPAAPIDEAAVRAALMAVNDKHGAEGMAKVADVLKPFAVQRIKELKPEQYAEVIAAAKKAAA